VIHYHGLPITGSGDPLLSMARRHCMVSYAHSDQVDTASEICQSFTLDNGAFTAWKGGKEFDFDGFCDFATKWALHPGCDWFLLPDVIDGTVDDNQKMRAKFFNSVDRAVHRKGVPIWHLHEPLELLEYFTRLDAPAVALGSSGDYAQVGTGKWWGRMAEAMKVACHDNGFPKARLHGLRMLDPDVFTRLPLSSADSTNVARNVGIDSAWKGAYSPHSRRMRAEIMMERIEMNNSAPFWNEPLAIQQDMKLI